MGKVMTSYVPPKSVQISAKRGLELRRKYGRGGLTNAEASDQRIGSGVQRAVNLSNGDAVSFDTIKRMRSFFARHEKNKNTPPEEGNGAIAWDLWGGDAGQSWANKIVNESLREKVAKIVQKHLSTHDEKEHGNRRNIDPIALRWAGGLDGFSEDGSYYTVYHGTNESNARGIQNSGLKTKKYTGANYFMVTTDKNEAKTFAEGYGGKAVVEFRIPTEKLKDILWKGKRTSTGDIEHGIKGNVLDKKYIHKVHS